MGGHELIVLVAQRVGFKRSKLREVEVLDARLIGKNSTTSRRPLHSRSNFVEGIVVGQVVELGKLSGTI